MEQVELPGFCCGNHETSPQHLLLPLLTHLADRCLHHCGCASRGEGGGCGEGGEGGRREGEGRRRGLGRVAALVPPARCFPRTLHILLFRGRTSPSSSSLSLLLISPNFSPTFSFPNPKISHLTQSPCLLLSSPTSKISLFPPKAARISPPPFPRTLSILLFLGLCSMRGGGLAPWRLPQVHGGLLFFYGTCIYHCDHSCAGVVQEPGS